MLYRSLSLAIVLACTSAPAFAQSATGNGSVTVVRPLTVAKNTDLQFGTVVRPSTGAGTVVVSTTGARSVTGGVVTLASGAAPTAAQFAVSGEGGQSVSLTIPSTFDIANGTDTLTVTTTNDLINSAASQTLSNAAGSAGTLVVNVGGGVPVGSTTPTGLYTGTFTVSAAYN